MQPLLVALLFLAASVSRVAADADADEAPAAAETTPLDDEWAQLSSAALVHLTQQHDAVVVLFTAPWCGECPRWRRTFGQARGKVKDDGLNVRMLVVDGLDPKNQQVVAAHGVARYPTTLAFTAGSQGLPYQGARELFALHSFVKDIAGPPVAVNPQSCLVRGGGAAAAAPHVMVGLFDSVDAAAREEEGPSASFAAFARAAASAPHHATLVRHVAYDWQHAAAFARCLEEAGVDAAAAAAEAAQPRVVYLRSFEPRLVEVLPPGGTLTVRAAHAAVERHAVPAVVQLVRDESGDSLHSALNNAFVSHPYVKVVYFPAAAGASAEEVDALRRAVRTSEEAEDGEEEQGGGGVPIRAAWAAPAFEEAAEFFAATGLARPCLIVVAADGRRYGEELEAARALRAADVLHLVDEVDAGAFAEPPRVKSEAWSEADAAEAARTHPEKPLRLTAARFGRDVETDTETTVCVLVHVPWCRFSQELLPVYEKVAAAYQTTRNIVVATLDASRNDLPGSVAGAIKGYPSILVFTRSMKRRGVVSPFVYDGNRSSADISAFILAHNELVDSYHADESDGGKATVLHAHLSADVPGSGGVGVGEGLQPFLSKVVTAMQLPITLPGDVSTTVLQCLLWAAVYIPGAVALLYGAYAKLYKEPRMRKRYTAEVERYVRAHKPLLLPTLPKLLTQYRGNEKVLYERMLVWYGDKTPADSASSPGAAASSGEPATKEKAKAAKKRDAAHPAAAAPAPAPEAEAATPKKKKARPSGKPKEE